jgi:hypothetical protein
MHKRKIKEERKDNLTATVCALSIYSLVRKNIFFLMTQQPSVGQGFLIHEVSRSHTKTHHSQ